MILNFDEKVNISDRIVTVRNLFQGRKTHSVMEFLNKKRYFIRKKYRFFDKSAKLYTKADESGKGRKKCYSQNLKVIWPP